MTPKHFIYLSEEYLGDLLISTDPLTRALWSDKMEIISKDNNFQLFQKLRRLREKSKLNIEDEA